MKWNPRNQMDAHQCFLLESRQEDMESRDEVTD